MVRTLFFTAALTLSSCFMPGQADAFHGRRGCGGGFGHSTPAVTSYYAPSVYRATYSVGPVYSSGYRGYSNPGYGYGGYGYGSAPYGYSGYRGGGISVGFGSGLGYGGYRNSGYGGYGGYGYPGYGW